MTLRKPRRALRLISWPIKSWRGSRKRPRSISAFPMWFLHVNFYLAVVEAERVAVDEAQPVINRQESASRAFFMPCSPPRRRTLL